MTKETVINDTDDDSDDSDISLENRSWTRPARGSTSTQVSPLNNAKPGGLVATTRPSSSGNNNNNNNNNSGNSAMIPGSNAKNGSFGKPSTGNHQHKSLASTFSDDQDTALVGTLRRFIDFHQKFHDPEGFWSLIRQEFCYGLRQQNFSKLGELEKLNGKDLAARYLQLRNWLKLNDKLQDQQLVQGLLQFPQAASDTRPSDFLARTARIFEDQITSSKHQFLASVLNFVSGVSDSMHRPSVDSVKRVKVHELPPLKTFVDVTDYLSQVNERLEEFVVSKSGYQNPSQMAILKNFIDNSKSTVSKCVSEQKFPVLPSTMGQQGHQNVQNVQLKNQNPNQNQNPSHSHKQRKVSLNENSSPQFRSMYNNTNASRMKNIKNVNVFTEPERNYNPRRRLSNTLVSPRTVPNTDDYLLLDVMNGGDLTQTTFDTNIASMFSSTTNASNIRTSSVGDLSPRSTGRNFINSEDIGLDGLSPMLGQTLTPQNMTQNIAPQPLSAASQTGPVNNLMPQPQMPVQQQAMMNQSQQPMQMPMMMNYPLMNQMQGMPPNMFMMPNNMMNQVPMGHPLSFHPQGNSNGGGSQEQQQHQAVLDGSRFYKQT